MFRHVYLKCTDYPQFTIDGITVLPSLLRGNAKHYCVVMQNYCKGTQKKNVPPFPMCCVEDKKGNIKKVKK